VSDGNAALDTLNQSQPAVLVLDLHLPGVSGDKILQFVRGDERLKSIQVIVATADATMADSLQELSDLVLIKPITFTQLRTLAARLRKGMN
jgi:CheY-like chemotaxis protein